MCLECPRISHCNKVTVSIKRLALVLLILQQVGFSNSINDCPEGYEYKASSDSCEECAIGFYKPTSSLVACSPCADGFVTMDTASVDITDCSVPLKDTGRCDAGSIWISVEERCDLCPVSTYRSGGSDYVCLSCPHNRSTAGTGSVSKRQCVGKCPIGHQWDSDSEICEPCPQGSYSDSDTYESCIKCTGSKETLQAGAGSKSTCYQPDSLESAFVDGDCPLGTEWTEPHDACVVCPLNTYRDDDSTDCTPCPPGTSYTIRTGATHRGLCVTTDQLQALENLHTNGHLCPVGMESSFSPVGCSPCPQGTYRDDKSQPHCELCDQCGQAQQGNREASSCPMGTEWHVPAEVCSLCPVGTYKTETSSAQCTVCQAGNTTWNTGAVSETACVIPLSGTQRAFFTQEDCPLGTEWRFNIQGCSPCPVSYYRDGTSRHCTPCTAGTTTETTGSGSIYQCVVPLQGALYAVTQVGCPHGMEADMTDGLCRGCPVNSYKNTTGAARCTDCPMNMSGQRATTTATHSTNELDCLVDILVTEVSPLSVLMVGGTVMRATLSTNASLIRLHSVFVHGVPCHHNNHLITDGQLVCTTDHFRRAGSGSMTVYVIHGSNSIRRHTSDLTVEVRPNPKVGDISRQRFFLSGGVDLVIGVGDLRPGTDVTILWYIGDRDIEVTQCSILASSIYCKVPQVTKYEQISDTDKTRKKRNVKSEPVVKVKRNTQPREPEDSLSIYMGLTFDGWDFYRNLTETLSENYTLKFFEDPVIHNLPGEPDVVNTFISRRKLTLTFQGNFLRAGCLAEDYIILIGDKDCQVTELTEDHVACSLSEESLDSFEHEILYNTKVTIGNLVYTPGYVRAIHPPTSPATAASSSPASVELAESAGHSTDNTRKTLQIVLPTIAGLAVLVTMIVILIYMLMIQRKSKAQKSLKASSPITSVWDPTLQDQAEIEHVNQRALPPLPVISVFGPARITDRGVTMRQLALPESITSSSTDLT